jgi:hypothetical protein
LLEMYERKYKCIALKPQTYLDLVSLGRKNESFDAIMSKLLVEHRGKNENNVAESSSGLSPRARLATPSDTVDVTQKELSHNIAR